MKVLMIFLDGFGLGVKSEDNPYFFAKTPFLDELTNGHILYDDIEIINTNKSTVIPVDANLDVEGIPQSATGQTTLWTGINAAKEAGQHINAYPTEELKTIIENNSIMKILAEKGKKVTFANAYRNEYFKLVEEGTVSLSTSTLTALSGNTTLRSFDDLLRGNAVYHEFTNSLLKKWGYEIDIISPIEAGKRLAKITKENDFTLFEYFITDRIGHKQDMKKAIEIYEMLDTFIKSVVEETNSDNTIILIVSDHGNIEDLSVETHTNNLVPVILINNFVNNYDFSTIKSLVDITPLVLDIIEER